MKRFLFISAFMAFIVVGWLFATDYNVLVYPENEEISTYIESFFANKPFDGKALDLMGSRGRTKEIRSLGEALDKAWATEDESKIDSARKAYEKALEEREDEIDISDFNVVLKSTKTHYDEDSMVTGDKELLDYICFTEDVDLIVIPFISDLQGFIHLAIYCHEYGGDGLELLYESVSKDSNRFSIRAALKLAPLFMEGTPAVLRLDNLVTGSEVRIDGTPVPELDGYVLTTEGDHSITIYAQGYASRSISTSLAGGEVSSLDASMVKMHFEALGIDSLPSATVRIDGLVVGQTPMVLDLYSVPLTMTLSAEGYADTTLSIQSRSKGINVELKPEWMADKDLIKVRKDSFYGSFARSLLLFGAKIALRALDDGSGKVLSALDIAADAAITVSIVDLVGRLIDYYRQSEYIAR